MMDFSDLVVNQSHTSTTPNCGHNYGFLCGPKSTLLENLW